MISDAGRSARRLGVRPPGTMANAESSSSTPSTAAPAADPASPVSTRGGISPTAVSLSLDDLPVIFANELWSNSSSELSASSSEFLGGRASLATAPAAPFTPSTTCASSRDAFTSPPARFASRGATSPEASAPEDTKTGVATSVITDNHEPRRFALDPSRASWIPAHGTVTVVTAISASSSRRAPKIRVVGSRFPAGVTRRRRPSSMHTNVDPRAGERLESRGCSKIRLGRGRASSDRRARSRRHPPLGHWAYFLPSSRRIVVTIVVQKRQFSSVYFLI